MGPFLSFRLTPASPTRELIALDWEERLKSRTEISHWGAQMKKPFFLAAIVFSGAILLQAGNKPQTGTIISENSVACGSTLEKGKKNKQISVEVLCQEYVVRTAGADYHIRQVKPSDKALIPINTPIEFTLDKDKIRFKANGKSYEYLVVSEAAAATTVDAIRP
jgi:hypothetical protein